MLGCLTLSAKMDSISDRVSIGEHEVHVWSARVPPDLSAERAAWAVLSPEEQARASRLTQRRDRSCRVRSWAFVRRVLAIYLQVAPQEVAIASGPAGKPEIIGGSTSERPRFSVSHSGSLALMAVSTNHEVGADVEEVRAELAWRDIADNCFSPAELEAIGHVPEADQRRVFFDCWVRKEAYLKGLGVGLRRGTTDFSVPVVATKGQVDDGGLASPRHTPTWHVYGLEIEQGFAASLAADGPVTVKFRSWPLFAGS
jgi:4'-phosphopantetheinyl transferase